MTNETDTEIEDDAESSSENKPRFKRLSPAEWAEIRTLWELGTVPSITVLAEQFGVTPSAISQHFKKNDVRKGSKSHLVAKEVEDARKSKAAERAAQIDQVKKESIEWATFIGKATMQEVVEAKKQGQNVGDRMPNIKALRTAMATLREVRGERYHVLEIDDHVNEKELPDLTVRDLSDEEIEHMRNYDPEALEMGDISDDLNADDD